MIFNKKIYCFFLAVACLPSLQARKYRVHLPSDVHLSTSHRHLDHKRDRALNAISQLMAIYVFAKICADRNSGAPLPVRAGIGSLLAVLTDEFCSAMLHPVITLGFDVIRSSIYENPYAKHIDYNSEGLTLKVKERTTNDNTSVRTFSLLAPDEDTETGIIELFIPNKRIKTITFDKERHILDILTNNEQSQDDASRAEKTTTSHEPVAPTEIE